MYMHVLICTIARMYIYSCYCNFDQQNVMRIFNMYITMFEIMNVALNVQLYACRYQCVL